MGIERERDKNGKEVGGRGERRGSEGGRGKNRRGVGREGEGRGSEGIKLCTDLSRDPKWSS